MAKQRTLQAKHSSTDSAFMVSSTDSAVMVQLADLACMGKKSHKEATPLVTQGVYGIDAALAKPVNTNTLCQLLQVQQVQVISPNEATREKGDSRQYTKMYACLPSRRVRCACPSICLPPSLPIVSTRTPQKAASRQYIKMYA